jgi:aspartate-semialdehyde dehydrogenase
MDELFNQTKAIYQVQEYKPKKMPHRIAFNVIPQIDVLMPDGSYKEEWKMVEETKKILDPAIQVIATCVRVPVFVGHSEAVYVEFEEEITVEEARDALDNAPGVVVLDRPEDNLYAMPVDCAGEDAVYVSRIRRDPTVPHGIAMWVVSDNLRKGAATNAVQIAEALVETYL